MEGRHRQAWKVLDTVGADTGGRGRNEVGMNRSRIQAATDSYC